MAEWGRKEYSKAWPSRTPVWTWMAFFLSLLFFAGMLTLEYEGSWTAAERLYLSDYLKSGARGKASAGEGIILLVILAQEGGSISQDSRHGKREDAPEIQQAVFNGCAGKREAMAGLQGAGGLRGLGVGILDVLRFIQDHERIVESAPAHERQRGHFDHALLHKARQFVGFQHVVQRVVQQTHVWIDFFLQRSRKKAQAFARFHRRPRQNDSTHLLGKQRRDRFGDREIGLSGPRRAGGKHHLVGFQRFHVKVLVDAFGRDALFASCARACRRKRAFQIRAGFFGGDLEQGFYFVTVWNPS